MVGINTKDYLFRVCTYFGYLRISYLIPSCLCIKCQQTRVFQSDYCMYSGSQPNTHLLTNFLVVRVQITLSIKMLKLIEIPNIPVYPQHWPHRAGTTGRCTGRITCRSTNISMSASENCWEFNFAVSGKMQRVEDV